MNYIALTIGPIYKTLSNAKKPKELWSASYIFSYIMREIIKEFKEREFVVPYIKDNSIFEDKLDIGLFHDRFIFKSKEGDAELLQESIAKVLKVLAVDLEVEYTFLKNYMQINFIEKELQNEQNPILTLMPYLDTKELFLNISQYEVNSLQKALKNKENFLVQNRNIVDDLKKLTYKKYFATVHVDADNMSRVIADKNALEEVSKNLFEYCINSSKLIKEFGGQTIFAGGDDLLFFAPVMSRGKTIFTLCDEISKDFDAKFNQVATLSFGVNITYIKHPLYEALQESRELLFVKAKSEKKNNIAFRVSKHSGQTFETIIHKGYTDIYQTFLDISSSIEDGDGVDNFLHSLHHKIDTHKVTLNNIASSKQKIENFFANYFNKDEHNQYREFFAKLSQFIYDVFANDAIKKEEKLNIIYATLRFVKFVKGDK